jgi:hypothetical protein
MNQPRDEQFSGLAAIDAPHFYAGVIVHRDQIIKTPPLLQYMRSWTYTELKKFVTDHHWRIAELRVLRQDGHHTAGLGRVHGRDRRQGHRLRNAYKRPQFGASKRATGK